MTRIRKFRGLLSVAAFEEGLRETVAWYRANTDWVTHVRSGEYLKYYERQYGDRQ